MFRNARAWFYLAYQNDKPVGRIAVIINDIEVNDQQKPKVRFGWFDVVDDIEVTKALLNKVEEIGKTENLEWMEGPVGFSNMERAGLLIQGFEYLNTMITSYNYPYYQEHFEHLGFEKAAEWVEFKIKIPPASESREKVKNLPKSLKSATNSKLFILPKAKILCLL